MSGGETSNGKIKNVGRIAERIVANELEFHGFTVRDLNIEGLAANADLLAVKDGKVWQIQVKGTSYSKQYEHAKTEGRWFQYGYCAPEHISNKDERMFNRVENSFKADIVVLICVTSPHKYQCFVLPVDEAERAAQINLDYAYRTPKRDGSTKKPNVVWTEFYVPEHTYDEKKTLMPIELKLLDQYRDKWDFDTAVSPSNSLQVS